MKFSALALPPHPLSLRLVPDSPAMEQEKSLPIRRGSVALVQARDCGGGRAEKLVVTWRTFSCGIGPVREQSETKVAVLTRQIMNLQAFDLLLEFRSRCQKSGHHDHRAQPGRYSVVKLQARQGCRADTDRDGAVHQRHGRVHCGDHCENRENEASPSADAGLHKREQRQGEDNRADGGDRSEITQDSGGGVGANNPVAKGSAKSELLSRATDALSR